MRLIVLAPVAAMSTAVTPVQKVVVMLKEMVGKGKEELAKEASIFEEIEGTVHKRLIDTGIEIEQNSDRVSKHTAAVAAAGADASKLDGEVATLTTENQKNNVALKDKIKFRKEEKTLYHAELKDMAESDDALTRAIGILKSQEGSIPVSLVQQIASTLPAAKANLQAYLEQPQASKEAYSFQSGGIVKMLKDLLVEFKQKLHELRTSEMNRDSAFQTWKADMEYEIKGTEKSIADKTKEAGEQRGSEGTAAGKRDQSQEALDAARKLKKETEVYFSMQTRSFKENQELRKGELSALAEAIKIMSSNEVSGAADKHMPSLTQTGASFLQVNVAQSERRKSLLKKATALIQQRNQDIFGNKSRALSMLNAQLLTGGTFDKVIKMIEDLIKKLEDQAGAELEHKKWCDKELKQTGEDKDKFMAEVDEKAALKEAKEAEKAENEAEIKRISEELKALAKEVKETTSERIAQKKENEITIAEAKSAQEATAKAIEVLETFYSKNAEGESFVQQSPEIATYSGMSGGSGGVIGLIETIQSDFAQLESDTAATESSASAEYAAFMKISKKNKETKEQSIHETKLENTSLAAQIRRIAKSLAGSSEQLESVGKYWTELQPMCTLKQVSYEDRVNQRKEEIQALKDAYQVLADQSGDV